MTTFTTDQIADACVKAGLGVLECNSLIVTLKAQIPESNDVPPAELKGYVSNAIDGYGVMLQDHKGTVYAIAKSVYTWHQAKLAEELDSTNVALTLAGRWKSRAETLVETCEEHTNELARAESFLLHWKSRAEKAEADAKMWYGKLQELRSTTQQEKLSAKVPPSEEREQVEASFKNFHRALCARFDYPHDPCAWRRDQVSLEDHIAIKIEKAEVALAAKHEQYALACQEVRMLKGNAETKKVLAERAAQEPYGYATCYDGNFSSFNTYPAKPGEKFMEGWSQFPLYKHTTPPQQVNGSYIGEFGGVPRGRANEFLENAVLASPPAIPQQAVDERSAFEEQFQLTTVTRSGWNGQRYSNTMVQFAWEGWHARSAQVPPATPQPADVEEDDNYWRAIAKAWRTQGLRAEAELAVESAALADAVRHVGNLKELINQVPQVAMFKWPNGCDTSIPSALRYLERNPRPSGGEDRYNGMHLLQLADDMESAVKRIATYTLPSWRSLTAEQLYNILIHAKTKVDEWSEHQEYEPGELQTSAKLVREIIMAVERAV